MRRHRAVGVDLALADLRLIRRLYLGHAIDGYTGVAWVKAGALIWPSPA